MSKDATPLKDRIRALLQALLQDSRINTAFQPVILKMAEGFLSNTDDNEIRDGIEKVRAEIIPWLLDEVPEDENPDQE